MIGEKIVCGVVFVVAILFYLYEGVTIPWSIIMAGAVSLFAAGAVSLFAFGVRFALRKVFLR